MDAIQRFTENVVRTTYDMLPASALAATKGSFVWPCGSSNGVWQIVLSFATLWGKHSSRASGNLDL